MRIPGFIEVMQDMQCNWWMDLQYWKLGKMSPSQNDTHWGHGQFRGL